MYNMETNHDKTRFWDIAVLPAGMTPRKLAFQLRPDSFQNGIDGPSWFLSLLLLGMCSENNLCASELTGVPLSREVATIAGDTTARQRPSRAKGKKGKGAKKPVRVEGEHAQEVPPRKEWVDEALRNLDPPYNPETYEPVFDGAADGADQVVVPHSHSHSHLHSHSHSHLHSHTHSHSHSHSHSHRNTPSFTCRCPSHTTQLSVCLVSSLSSNAS